VTDDKIRHPSFVIRPYRNPKSQEDQMSEITLQEAVKKFASDLATKVNTFVADVAELEVYTFTTPPDQIQAVFKGPADFANLSEEAKAALRAYTKISFDGDMVVWLPITATGEVDRSVWDMHQATVKQAMENRKAMIQTMGDTASSALKALGIATSK
jgi:hypothetical protein